MSTYEEALEWIYSFTDYEKKTSYRYAPELFDLTRMERLLASLHNPHRRFRSLHIAGTKGKGSTAAISESILRAAGHKTGLYTSPHLHTFRERIQVEGRLIPEREVALLVERLQPFVSQVEGLTTFEIITALAFLYFAHKGVELAVLEVGLGGRLDATNVITPSVSIITSLSYDHTTILGDSLSEIAREKGGIIKPGIPVVSAPQSEEALAVIEQICEERDSALTLVGRDWRWDSKDATWEGQSFSADPTFQSSGEALSLEYWIPLVGRHQLVNATVVLAAMEQLREQGLRISQSSIHEGLRKVRWPGRLEVLSQRPWVVVDGAHNRDSAQKLRSALEELFPHRHLFLIFATYRDKDIAGMLEVLLPIAQEVITTQFKSPRAATADQLAGQVRDAGTKAASVEDIGQALSLARQRASAEDLICVAGSVRFAGETRMAYFEAEGLPLPPRDPRK
ncbi:MAG: folylpolyglutamate synthase/dihydrofolate synthase family protein [Chloroflexota bacterium]|nr:folylpolyglutamate synthase/dihydrofolate synthase family protein [Chloroflexota bacterium]